MARPRKFGEVREKRITISVTKTEQDQIEADAKKAQRSISDYLVSCAIKRANLATVATGADATRMSVSEAVGALETGGFALDYLNSINLHPAIRDSIGDYQGALQRGGDDFREALRRTDFIPKTFSYPADGSTDDFQKKILEEVLRFDDFGKRTAFRSPKNSEAHFARPGLIARKRIIYLYPFFLHPSRRPYWGVIPYAQHKRIGLLLNTDTFPTLADEPVVPGERAWLGRVIDDLCEKDELKIGFAEGFFEEEIAEVIWSNSQSTHEFDFEMKRKPLPAGELYRFDESPAQFTDLLNRNNVKLLVFDLCYRADVEARCNGKWKVVEYPHGATVPVGIGFTLSFLPRLLAHNNWRSVRKRALDTLNGLCPTLSKHGFEVEQDNWNLPNCT